MGMNVGIVGGGNATPLNFFVGEAITAGQVLVRTVTADSPAEVADPASVNVATLAVGCAMNAATYTATPTANPNQVTLENLVRIEVNPKAIWRFAIAGGVTAGTVLVATTTTPANVLTQDTASATVIADTAVGTISHIGGLIKGRTGANKGAVRRISAHTDNVSETVTVAFVNSVAVGDTLIRVPYSRAVVEAEWTTNFVEVNGIETTAGGGSPIAVFAVHIDVDKDTAYLDLVFADHWMSPVAVGADLS